MSKNECNIVYLIGNGFDISILKQFSNKNTSYYEFYNFLQEKKKEGIIENNSVLDRIEKDKVSGKENWSDFEATTGEMLLEGKYEINKLKEDFEEFQYKFSEFLYDIVTPELMKNLDNKFSQKNSDNGSAEETLFGFVKDIIGKNQLNKLNLIEKIKHNIDINYTFFNFNYTNLFDSYIYLDKFSFDPKEYKSSGNNRKFNINPLKYTGLHTDSSEKFVKIKK